MHIVVCVKAVPGSTEVKMDPATHTIVRDGREAVINPFDASALEVALGLKDACAARGEALRVSVLSMGIPATEVLLRDCVARGADDALLLSDRAFAGADTLATSYVLSLGIERLGGADLILCGKMAVDGDTAQIGPELAGLFGLPCVTDVRAVVSVTSGAACVLHRTDSGMETVSVTLPAVLTVAKECAQPRMPSIAGVLGAQSVPVDVAGAHDMAADRTRIGLAGSPTQVVRSFVPTRSNTCEVIEGSIAEQAARIIEVAKEAGL